MLVHSLLVESVDLSRLGGSAGGNDVVGDRFHRCAQAPGQKKVGPLARKGACDGTADRASGAVDHRDLVLQHQLWFLSVPGSPIRRRHESRPTALPPQFVQALTFHSSCSSDVPSSVDTDFGCMSVETPAAATTERRPSSYALLAFERGCGAGCRLTAGPVVGPISAPRIVPGT